MPEIGRESTKFFWLRTGQSEIFHGGYWEQIYEVKSTFRSFSIFFGLDHSSINEHGFNKIAHEARSTNHYF